MLDTIYDLSLSSMESLVSNILLLSILAAALAISIYIFYMNSRHKKVTKVFSRVLFVMYLVSLALVTIYRNGEYMEVRQINIIPIQHLIDSYNISKTQYPDMAILVLIYNIFGNILWFVPMGIGLTCFLKDMTLGKVVLFSFIISLWIELTQYILMVGITDIDDLIFNTIGGAIGYLLYQKFRKKGAKA